MAVLEREFGFECRRLADRAGSKDEVRALSGLAGLHMRAAALLEQLAIVYDEIDVRQPVGSLRRTS